MRRTVLLNNFNAKMLVVSFPVQFTNWVTDENLRWTVEPNARDEKGNRIGPVINYTLDWYKIVEPPSCEY